MNKPRNLYHSQRILLLN